jgi:hypothetical protein
MLQTNLKLKLRSPPLDLYAGRARKEVAIRNGVDIRYESRLATVRNRDNSVKRDHIVYVLDVCRV